MARKTVSLKEKRQEHEAAEAMEKAAPKKKKAAAKKTPRKSRAKKAADVQLKLFWGVFNQTMKRVALYEYSQKKQAQEKADQLIASSKAPHFIQKVKEEVEVVTETEKD